MTADDKGYAALARKISREAGFVLEAYKDKCIRRRIAVRMRACGVHTYGEYTALLDRTPVELERLRDALTINVTRFYRNPDTWDALSREVLPSLCASPAAELRAWSAGCSSGEEAYTLAMLVAADCDRRGRPEQLDRLTIDATDIDRASLERATIARYWRESLGDMPPRLVQAYFEPGDPAPRVVERVRRRVQVRRLDLSRDPPPGRHYHLILCRNVLIYFDRPTQEQLSHRFVDALVPGGTLVLGRVETLTGPARDQLVLVDPRQRIYRRPE